MTSQEEKVARALGIKTGKKNEKANVTFLKNATFIQNFKKTWYFDTWFEKIIYILGFIALAYSVARILIQGFW